MAKGEFRFRKKERIVLSRDFKKVMRLGRRRASKNFVLFILESEHPFHRLGIVAKKEIGPATFRNRIKRYIREFFRLHKHQISGCLDIILLIKANCSVHRYKETEEELKRLFSL
ncbi:MAG: ribonuclease P protein component [Thermodesulfobacteriota bacterium]